MKELKARGNPEPLLVSIEDVVASYPGEWVLMKVTALDQDHLPKEGQIMARATSHKTIWKKFSKLVSPSEKPATPYYVFQAYPFIRSGDEMRSALAEAAEKGAPGAWRQW